MTALPAPVAATGATRARELDARPLLARGVDPFAEIMKAAGGLAPDEALHLIVGFEPKPLYLILGERGFEHHTEA